MYVPITDTTPTLSEVVRQMTVEEVIADVETEQAGGISLSGPALRTLLSLYPNGCSIIPPRSVEGVSCHAQALDGTQGALVGWDPHAGYNADGSAGCLGITRKAYLRLPVAPGSKKPSFEPPHCQCWNEGQWGRVHREDCPIHGPGFAGKTVDTGGEVE